MLKYVALVGELSQEYFYCGELLLIDAALPVERILEIIRVHLGGDVAGD